MFIVVFDDENNGLCVPYGWDEDCDGALEANSGDVALFDSRKQARTAITISARYARLCEAQGKPANEDFTVSAGLIKVRRLRAKEKR